LGAALPEVCDRLGERSGGGVAAALRAVHADEIGVAEAAGGGGAVGFVAAPEVAAGEAAEDGGVARLRAFALESKKDFLDGVAAGRGFRNGGARIFR
jgi:hypothetical protein